MLQLLEESSLKDSALDFTAVQLLGSCPQMLSLSPPTVGEGEVLAPLHVWVGMLHSSASAKPAVSPGSTQTGRLSLQETSPPPKKKI